MSTLRESALRYHENPPGKLAIRATKPMATQADLSLAYTPGVAEPVKAIAEDPSLAYRYTAKGNLIAVVSNGSAILGLGNRGPLASKPVMEGKAILFKELANVDVFDLEIDCQDADSMVEVVRAIAPTFGGINLEDIKAPECFEVEKRLQAMLDIPVFHDDQHGTAIVLGAALSNALGLQGKALSDCRVVFLGAGAAAIACRELLIAMGAQPQQICLVDRQGVIHSERKDLPEYKAAVAIDTPCRTLSDAMAGADVFVGVSGPNLVDGDMIRSMNDNPAIFALSNPDPEITPEAVSAVRDDAIMATGRSDYPNQINNVLCFPYIFRGALDARAHAITLEMKLAAVKALSQLAREPIHPELLNAYPHVNGLSFGPQYIIPLPTDPRLLEWVAGAVAKAAR